MLVTLELPSELLKNRRAVANIARELARVSAKINECYLAAYPALPALYESGVRYKPEPWAGQKEEFANVPTVLARLWGDCDDLVPWRVAEIRRREKRPADVLVYWRPTTGTYHLQVRHWPSRAAQRAGRAGDIEDPSRLLGMTLE